MITRLGIDALPIGRIRATAYVVPTEAPEADGTLEWRSTGVVVAEVQAGPVTGLGYAYANAAAAELVGGVLAEAIAGQDALAIPAAWQAMVRAVRNLGRPGLASSAVAALDVALWDLKARALGLPLAVLLGQAREAVPVYGSGGFTSYGIERLREQLAGWAAQGMGAVKMKVGSRPEQDRRRVAAAREAIGGGVQLFVDANGAYARKQALAFAEAFAEAGVTWFEEPVSSDDLAGLRLLRDRLPATIEVAAGEYGYDAPYFRRMLAAGAVDVLQADATRCLGITGFLRAAALAEAFMIPLSAHTAPALHVHVCCAAPAVRNLEYFHDHVRVEALLFDGAPLPHGGLLAPDLTRPGLGLSLRRADAARFEV
jgi:L-alanine-DL-glutamate epimerase-like enolase superfamily enzyme